MKNRNKNNYNYEKKFKNKILKISNLNKNIKKKLMIILKL